VGLRHSPEGSNIHLAVSNCASSESYIEFYTEIVRRDVQFTVHNAVTSA